MTTVLNPSGTPTVVYTRSGTTIVSVTANGNTQAAATPIAAVSGHTVALVTTSSSSDAFAVALPSDAQVGDLVEVHLAAGGLPAIDVFPPSGETIIPEPSDTSIGVVNALLRKVASSAWVAVNSATF